MYKSFKKILDVVKTIDLLTDHLIIILIDQWVKQISGFKTTINIAGKTNQQDVRNVCWCKHRWQISWVWCFLYSDVEEYVENLNNVPKINFSGDGNLELDLLLKKIIVI